MTSTERHEALLTTVVSDYLCRKISTPVSPRPTIAAPKEKNTTT
jgi:hypothetical protein